jgi:hypothetical protein
MAALILLTTLDTLDLFRFDLTSLLEYLGHMAMTVNTADFRHVLVTLNKGLVVLQGLALTG